MGLRRGNLLGEGSADHDFIRAIQSLAGIEAAPAQDWNPERREIARIGPAVNGQLRLSRGQRRMLDDGEGPSSPNSPGPEPLTMPAASTPGSARIRASSSVKNSTFVARSL